MLHCFLVLNYFFPVFSLVETSVACAWIFQVIKIFFIYSWIAFVVWGITLKLLFVLRALAV